MTKRREDLRSALEDASEMGWFRIGLRAAQWEVKSKNILDDDLGSFEDSTRFDYDLDEASRDRLLAHARQDAAMAFYASADAHAEASSARLWSWLSFLVLLLILF